MAGWFSADQIDGWMNDQTDTSIDGQMAGQMDQDGYICQTNKLVNSL